MLLILNRLRVEILVHPKSFEEIKRDLNEDRKKIVLSKLNTYTLLESPPDQSKDNDFLNVVGYASKPNDHIDNTILYSIYRDAADFLITEDKGIHKKAIRLNIKDRVLSLDDALGIFEKGSSIERIGHPPAIKEEVAYNLNINDPFFYSLKEEYGKLNFEKWFKEISRKARRCWVHFNEDNSIGALLIYKIESESIDDVTPYLPAKKRLKLSTFKVTQTGYKIGELFIKLSIKFALKNNLFEMYLTHFTKPDDYFVDLISEYGFHKVAVKSTGEDIYIKELLVDKESIKSLPPTEICKKFYPNFYDGTLIKKFIIPIRPKYHERLFIEYKGRQTTLPEHVGEFIIEGNTIKKAYLSNSRITKITPGDILLFYRSEDKMELTSLGVVENVFPRVQDKDEIMRHVGKRTVYSVEEIEKMAKDPTIVILFTSHFYLSKPLKLNDLIKTGIIKGVTRSITQISHENYLKIKSQGGIDERFAIS
ncbi:MAG: hypothetical protein OIN85_02760 [Candidatus Methanoperedens sp.]|nr:hypothetical protein [Candidatus Methanoperedens sp.]